MTYTRRYMRIIAICLAALMTVCIYAGQAPGSVYAAVLTGGTGSIDVSVEDDDLVISYSGSWTNYLNEKIQLSADGIDFGAYSQIVLSTNNSGDSGTYTVKNAWYNDIAGAEVTVQNYDPQANYGYGSMTWTIRVPVSTYDSYNIPALTLTWGGQSTSVQLGSQAEQTATTENTEQSTQEVTTESAEQSTQEVTTESAEQTTEEVTDEDTEQTTRETTTESTEQTTQETTTESTEQSEEEVTSEAAGQTTEKATTEDEARSTQDVTTESGEQTTEDGSGSAIVVGGGIQIDGYYDDWSGYPKTQITYTSNNRQCNHYGQLAIDGDTLYGHFKMNELYMTSMQLQIWYITINGQQYALQIQPEKNGSVDWSTQVSRAVGTHTNLKVFVGYGNNNECDSNVAYTVYNTNYGAEGSQGDEIEFSLSLSRLAELTGISEDSMGTITIYNPNIGSEGVTIAGSSTGAAIPVCVAAGMAFLYVARLRKKKNM